MLAAANLDAHARTSVETDYQGDVVARTRDAHQFAEQLRQVVQAVAIRIAARTGCGFALRSAPDSVPPLRLEVLNWRAPGASTLDVRGPEPRRPPSIRVQALHVLGLVTRVEFQRPKRR